MPTKNTEPHPWDKCHAALQELKKEARVPYEKSQELKDSCYKMISLIQRILEYPPQAKDSAGLVKLGTRLHRIIELANIQECGALQIQISKEAEAVWDRMKDN